MSGSEVWVCWGLVALIFAMVIAKIFWPFSRRPSTKGRREGGGWIELRARLDRLDLEIGALRRQIRRLQNTPPPPPSLGSGWSDYIT